MVNSYYRFILIYSFHLCIVKIILYTAALLDRPMHRAEAIQIAGQNFRMKERLD